MSSPDSDKSWSKARLERVYANFQSDRPEQVANLVNPEIAKPLHQNSIARMAVVLAAAGVLAVVGWIAFNGKSKSPVAIDPSTPVAVEDATANSEGWKAAATQSTANGLPVDVPAKTTPSVAPTVKPTPATPVVKTVPAPVVKTVPAPVVTAASKPQIVYKTIYRTLPVRSQPLPRPTPAVVVKALPSPPKTASRPVVTLAKPLKSSPPSFIPIAGGGRTRVAIGSTTVRVKRRQPLASENILLASRLANPTVKSATLIPGMTVTGHLISPLQSSASAAGIPGKPGATRLSVALERPLPTAGGDRIPIGAMVTFAATIDPQNGVVTAVSGNAWSNGKTISMPSGAIAIQSANNRPLIATSFKPRTGELASADTNNALLNSAGQVGEELTKSTTSINVGNGSTIIQQTNNPNIWGAVLKGGFQTWATDQRQRTQTQASQINALQPIQYLAQGTPVTLTVARPARIIIPR